MSTSDATAATAREPWHTHAFGRVWCLPTDEAARADATRPRASTALPAVVQQRAARFVHPRDAARYLHAHHALHEVLESVRPAPMPAWSIGSHGKPSLPGGPAFNLSRRDDWAAFIVAGDARPVGIDLEVPRFIEHAFELALEHFTADEIDELTQAPEAQRSEVFLHGWTRKEAVMKAAGLGLWLPAASFHVGLAPKPARARIRAAAYHGEIDVDSLPPHPQGPIVAVARAAA